ncbi:hypothetical protein B0H63DRAFT_520893 [Podospora didyma]|uniref:TauD/TfdA-like domain-containing protein n=1 Tax=Podospora didyma TaxID=330526 RepID=A0AAE0NSD8_9PEZI|nr:hypothetical protein B0H63DRAFT_520893 [Podospora didyma]
MESFHCDKIWFGPLPPFKFEDPALRVKDVSLPNLLKSSAKLTNIQPGLGVIVEGVQLNQLDDAAKDELAYLISHRKVMAFAKQDLIDDGPTAQQEFMDYSGKRNYQPVSGSPPGYVMLGLLQGPEIGGDTVFAATDAAYKRLSPALQSLLDKLQAVHTSIKMIGHAKAAGGLVRKDPVETVHLLVRVHPVTGQKCIFINGGFIARIVGLKNQRERC